MIIQTQNKLTANSPKSFLSFNEASGTNVLRWKNYEGFAASWAVQIGETGEEQSEVVLLGTATPAGTAGTLTANTRYEHSADTPIYAIKYDQVVFERATAGTTGTASPMTSGTKTIQSDRLVTEFDDTSGSAGYGYKTYLRNSVLNSTTIESDWITSGGFSFYSLANIRSRTKGKLWDATYIKEDSTIDEWTNEWKDELTNGVISVNEDYALGTENVAFGTDGLGTVTTADFKQVRRVWITTDGVNSYQSTKTTINDIEPNQVFSSTHPYHAWKGDSVFQVNPSDTAGTASLIFYRLGTTLKNDTDELPLPMRGYTKSFVDYNLAQAFLKDGKLAEYQQKMAETAIAKQGFINELVPRDKTGPQMIKLVEGISGEDYNIW
jgi:hypothetical protein